MDKISQQPENWKQSVECHVTFLDYKFKISIIWVCNYISCGILFDFKQDDDWSSTLKVGIVTLPVSKQEAHQCKNGCSVLINVWKYLTCYMLNKKITPSKQIENGWDLISL